MAQQVKPTQAELEILSVLWELEAATVRQIHDVLNRRKPTGYTTVLKLLQLMDGKNLVERDRARRAHVYRAQIKQQETGKQMLGELKFTAFSLYAYRFSYPFCYLVYNICFFNIIRKFLNIIWGKIVLIKPFVNTFIK